jgi:type II secretory pathway component PulM
MSFADSISEKLNSSLDSIKDQQWYQQISNSYQQLSPEQQSYVRWGGLGLIFILLVYLIYSATDSANSVKTEYFEKQELLAVVNQAGDEIRRLKGQNSGFAGNVGQNWRSVLQNVVSSQGLAPEALEVTKESAGTSQSMIQETLIEATLKGVTIRPLVQILYQIEHHSPPMKLKGLKVDALSDGQLNASLIMSGYMPKGDKKP